MALDEKEFRFSFLSPYRLHVHGLQLPLIVSCYHFVSANNNLPCELAGLAARKPRPPPEDHSRRRQAIGPAVGGQAHAFSIGVEG